jgi:hypothetical protein
MTMRPDASSSVACSSIQASVRSAGSISLSNVYGGLANGYLAARTIDPSVNLRIRF